MVLDDAMWYASVMEEVAGGAEVAAMGGVNVAELMLKRWTNETANPPMEIRIPACREDEVIQDGKCVRV